MIIIPGNYDNKFKDIASMVFEKKMSENIFNSPGGGLKVPRGPLTADLEHQIFISPLPLHSPFTIWGTWVINSAWICPSTAFWSLILNCLAISCDHRPITVLGTYRLSTAECKQRILSFWLIVISSTLIFMTQLGSCLNSASSYKVEAPNKGKQFNKAKYHPVKKIFYLKQ